MHSFLKQIIDINNIFNSHFKSPAKFSLLILGGDQVVGHDELLEVKEAVTVGVQGPEHVIAEAHRGDPGRKEGGELRPRDRMSVRCSGKLVTNLTSHLNIPPLG